MNYKIMFILLSLLSVTAFILSGCKNSRNTLSNLNNSELSFSQESSIQSNESTNQQNGLVLPEVEFKNDDASSEIGVENLTSNNKDVEDDFLYVKNDNDNDDIPDYKDTDDDNDDIDDIKDIDADGNGNLDKNDNSVYTNNDNDNDGKPDYIDTDDDNDEIDDIKDTDADGNGIVDIEEDTTSEKTSDDNSEIEFPGKQNDDGTIELPVDYW